MNYYPFHIGDYASATRHLSWDEDAAYRRLLDVYYTTEKPLPLELRAVCRLVIATTDVQREAVAVVLEEFFEQTEAGWVNRRADAEIAAMRERQQKQRDKANKRWQKPRPEPGNAPAMPQHRSRDAAASKADAVAMPPTPTPTPTPTPKKVGKNPPNPPRCALPDWIDPDAWAAWKRHRRAIRKPLTPDAEALSLRELAKMRGDGFDPKAVIENAILKGWQGLYPPKDAQSPPAPRPRRESVVEHNERAFDEWEKSFDDGRTLDA